MTRDGKENRFGRFILDDEQAERINAGDYNAVWDFMQANKSYIIAWAKRKVYWHLNGSFGYLFYEVDELINQVYLDIPFYNLADEKSICVSMWWTFRKIGFGGYCSYIKSPSYTTSLNASVRVSERSGDTSDGETLGDILPAYTPLPDKVLENQYHIKQIAGHYFKEIGEALGISEEESNTSGASIGQILAYRNGNPNARQEQFRDIIEYIFHGYLFEEIKQYAQVSR